MCGLIGYHSKKQDYNQDKIKYLILDNEKRGVDSTGLFVHSDKGNAEARSIGKCSEDFLPVIKFPNYGTLLIGHTRARTNNITSLENAHPFKFDNIVGAHNGRITNHSQLINKFDLKYSEITVDSKVIYCLMNKFKQEGNDNFIIDTLKLLEGPQALLFTDLEEHNKLYFFRRKADFSSDERPLFKGTLKVNDEDVYYLSSLKTSLKAIGCSNVQEIEENVLYSLCEEGLKEQKIDFYKEPVKHISNFNNNNHHNNNIKTKCNIYDYEEIFKEDLKMCIMINSDNFEVKDKNKLTLCTNCDGHGFINHTKCFMCEGSGWCENIIKRGNFNYNDYVIITEGFHKGSKGQIKGFYKHNNNYRIEIPLKETNVTTFRTMFLEEKEFEVYKTAGGIFVKDLEEIMLKIESVDQNKNFKIGDIVKYEDVHKGEILTEIISNMKTGRIIEVKDISPKCGRKHSVHIDLLTLVTESDKRINSTLQDVCEIINTHYQVKSSNDEEYCLLLLTLDDEFDQLLENISTSDRASLQAKIYSLKELILNSGKKHFEKELMEVQKLITV